MSIFALLLVLQEVRWRYRSTRETDTLSGEGQIFREQNKTIKKESKGYGKFINFLSDKMKFLKN